MFLFFVLPLNSHTHIFFNYVYLVRFLLFPEEFVGQRFLSAKSGKLRRLRRRSKRDKIQFKKIKEKLIVRTKKYYDDMFLDLYKRHKNARSLNIAVSDVDQDYAEYSPDDKDYHIISTEYPIMTEVPLVTDEVTPQAMAVELNSVTSAPVSIPTDSTPDPTTETTSAPVTSSGRRRRSAIVGAASLFTNPYAIGWALTKPASSMMSSVQRDEIALALSLWESSSNLCFVESTAGEVAFSFETSE